MRISGGRLPYNCAADLKKRKPEKGDLQKRGKYLI